MSPTGIDNTDKKIISILQKEGRITNVKLAKRVQLSPPSVLERVRKLEEKGIIQKYVALVEPAKVGYNLTSFILCSLELHKTKEIERFRSEIERFHEVLEGYFVSGESDFLMKVVVHDIQAYRDFLTYKLSNTVGIRKIKSLIVFETVKNETSLQVLKEDDPKPIE